MPIAFGRIKKVFVDAKNPASGVWLVASSGVYLLKHENVAPEYKDIHYKFLQTVNSTYNDMF